MAGFSIETGFFSAADFRAEKYGKYDMSFKYGAIIHILHLTFYMKLMIAYCSMSIFLPIVTIFI